MGVGGGRTATSSASGAVHSPSQAPPSRWLAGSPSTRTLLLQRAGRAHPPHHCGIPELRFWRLTSTTSMERPFPEGGGPRDLPQLAARLIASKWWASLTRTGDEAGHGADGRCRAPSEGARDRALCRYCPDCDRSPVLRPTIGAARARMALERIEMSPSVLAVDPGCMPLFTWRTALPAVPPAYWRFIRTGLALDWHQ